MIKNFILYLLFISILAGCTNDKPVPKGFMGKSIETFGLSVTPNNNFRVFDVLHSVKGNNVYVECVIPNFTFKQSGGPKKDGEGHIAVYIDGKKVDKFSTAAFIIKGLSNGEHHLKIQIIHNDLTEYPLSKIIDIEIK
ncbi:hypothetical protein [Fredinandcohnia quinoae]|uniref:Lipoprotein n=1 Tax=Fredinandcohnia quinoae TaxID=2918902 RepID=A0AAW5E545_9BACI|nr:hypothetical protein [Fredinandcohnia sp. SECRCQ15]MCH1623904.1 hypothetical protein [Fredinandcohnia sp. SECRCQ15]